MFVPATAELAILSTFVAVIVGVTFGVIAAVRRNRFTDHALRVVSLAGISMPTFWIALVALYLFFFRLGWFPGGDRLDPGVLLAALSNAPRFPYVRTPIASSHRQRWQPGSWRASPDRLLLPASDVPTSTLATPSVDVPPAATR
jgi:ABC-type dipeptide/oligopeptide/nickel transport system permease component